MDLLDITQCKKDFDFKPLRKKTDSLPCVAWNRYLLMGFDRTIGIVLNVNSPLPALLRDCYPDLSLPELARFLETLTRHPALFAELKEDILAAFQLKDHPDLDEILAFILTLPIETQNWMGERQLSARELAPIRLTLKTFENRLLSEKVLEWLFERRATRSQTVRMIDLASDLILMGRRPFPEVARTTEIWIRHLEQERHPITKSRDRECETTIKQLPWPSHVQARWVRDGDSAGIEVKFNIHNKHDLEKLLDGLERLSPQLDEELWKRH